MRLLFDNNVSYKLVKKLSDIVPGCIHVSNIGLPHPANDMDIWSWAKINNCTIVTFDEDFEQIEILNGFPPKVILFRFGNTPTAKLEQIIRANWSVIKTFLLDTTSGLLEIY